MLCHRKPGMNPSRALITGKVCGSRRWKSRYLDKLIDELAKGNNAATATESSITWQLSLLLCTVKFLVNSRSGDSIGSVL